MDWEAASYACQRALALPLETALRRTFQGTAVLRELPELKGYARYYL